MRITRELGPQDFFHQGKKVQPTIHHNSYVTSTNTRTWLLPKRNRSRRQGGALIWWCDHSSGEELLEEDCRSSKGPFFGRFFRRGVFCCFFNIILLDCQCKLGENYEKWTEGCLSLQIAPLHPHFCGCAWSVFGDTSFEWLHCSSPLMHRKLLFFSRPAVPLKVTHVMSHVWHANCETVANLSATQTLCLFFTNGSCSVSFKFSFKSFVSSCAFPYIIAATMVMKAPTSWAKVNRLLKKVASIAMMANLFALMSIKKLVALIRLWAQMPV